MRELIELVNLQEPGWAFVQEWIREGKNHVEVLPASDPQRSEALFLTQVTTRSPMGAVIYETGGILVDYGWLRILGSGHPRLPRTLPQWNVDRHGVPPGSGPFLIVADDVVGGFFAVSGPSWGEPGLVYYGSPDKLYCENTKLKYSDFLEFCFSGDLNEFYKNLRWKGWKEEIANLAGDRGIDFYPYLFTQESKPIEKCSRKDVPLSELFDLHKDLAKQLYGDGSGARD